MHIFYNIKKYLWCSWIHRYHKCYPQDEKYWHCDYCHPCWEGFYFIPGADKEEYKKALREQREHDNDLIKQGLIPHWWQKCQRRETSRDR